MKYLGGVARTHGLLLELTSPYTPQLNGVVERHIAVLKLKSQAMLTQAQLTTKAKNVLWAEAVRCANTLENLTMTSTHPIAPFEKYME